MLPLTPKTTGFAASVLQEKQLLTDLLDAFGSPLNILLPSKAEENARAFQEVFRKHRIRGSIHFAHKANKSRSLIRQFLHAGISIDVASTGELQQALGAGFAASQIECTGPKDREFLFLALRHGCMISVDSQAELETICALHHLLKLSAPVSILLRFSGFEHVGTTIKQRDSRFGIPMHHLKEVIDVIAEKQHTIALRGFAFHLDTIALREKIIAIENLLPVFHECRDRGLSPSLLNIGGGFHVNYLASQDEWHAYITGLQEAAMGRRDPLTWNGSSMGFRNENGVLRGSGNFYDFYAQSAGATYLDELLSSSLPQHDGISLGRLLSESMIDLVIEPGRALLDEAGMTMAEVNVVKESANGEKLVGLRMNRTNLWSVDQEILVDPIVIPRHTSPIRTEEGVYLIGNLCLESDLMFRHKAFLGCVPQTGDVLAFINTAAYYMDFAESNTIQQPVAAKVCIVPDRGRLRWHLDEQYNPYFHSHA